MSPRRLLPYLVVFLVLLGTYAGLRWHQAQKETREQQAKQVFAFQAAEISAVTLKRDQAEIQLTRQGSAWEITKPLKAGADALTVGDLVKALAQLKLERDLGPGDLKGFGLDKPGLVVSFTAKGQPHQLALGSPAPGGRGFYVRKDEGPNILLIAAGVRDSLDHPLDSLRDKTVWAFDPGQVKSVKLRTDKTAVHLEKRGATWTWMGRPDFRVRADRVEQLLQRLREARITGFPPAPKDLKTAGLAPRAQTEVTVATPQGTQTLSIGARVKEGYYARVGGQGPVVQVGLPLPDEIARTIPILEDRRLWSGALLEVRKVVWGTPAKTWTATKEKDFWKLTGGPDKAALKQAPPRLEMALVNFQNLEYASLLPQTGTPRKEAFFLEFFDATGKSRFRLDELGPQGQAGVGVRTQTGGTVVSAVVSQQNFSRWQQEMARLITPPPQPKK